MSSKRRQARRQPIPGFLLLNPQPQSMPIMLSPCQMVILAFGRLCEFYCENPSVDYKESLKGLKYRTSGNNRLLKYFFSTLNEHSAWYIAGANGKPQPDNSSVINYDNVTIEHISSQSANNPLPEFSGDNVHHFFNLTILTNEENNNVKAKDYLQKKAVYQQSKYKLNNYFSSIDSWDITQAQRWQEYIVDMACKIFVV